MGKLTFKHGTMHSSKTAQLLMEAHNYQIQGKKVIGLRPSLDSRNSEGFIESRTPLNKLPCYMIDENQAMINVLQGIDLNEYSCIMIDESQFLTPRQIYQLHNITVDYDIDVLAYGLKNSYIKGELFPGSSALLFYADSVDEIKTVCQYCNKKATQNLRFIGDKPTYSGDTVKIGDIKGEEKYIQVCNYHYSKGGSVCNG